MTTSLGQYRLRPAEGGVERVVAFVCVLSSCTLRWDDSQGVIVYLPFVYVLLYQVRWRSRAIDGRGLKCEVICASL